MISDELLNKFDNIEDLPISEEMLGAYMEGKLDAATSAFVEYNLIDSPAHADFVESLKEIWNMHEISMSDFSSSEISLPEEATIEYMDLPPINTDNTFNGFDTFNDVAFSNATNIHPSGSPYGDEFIPIEFAEWEALDENNDTLSHGTDIFSDDNQSLNIDDPDGMDSLSNDL